MCFQCESWFLVYSNMMVIVVGPDLDGKQSFWANLVQNFKVEVGI